MDWVIGGWLVVCVIGIWWGGVVANKTTSRSRGQYYGRRR